MLTSGEKGETVTVVACNNAEGRFLPLVIILKGVNKKLEYTDGLPPGSDVFMNAKSAYINGELFFKWFREIFLPRWSPGINLLILDGHVSHCNYVSLLDMATENQVILFCLPSHTTHALQPLDESFFGTLKHYFELETHCAFKNKGKDGIKRLKVGTLLGEAWKRAACGIYPFRPQAVPDHLFAISDAIPAPSHSEILSQPSTSAPVNPVSVTPTTPKKNTEPTSSSESTPRKELKKFSSLPKFTAPKITKRKLSASSDNISKRREKSTKTNLKQGRKTIIMRRNKQGETASEIFDSGSTPISENENKCVECWENYYLTKRKDDWMIGLSVPIAASGYTSLAHFMRTFVTIVEDRKFEERFVNGTDKLEIHNNNMFNDDTTGPN